MSGSVKHQAKPKWASIKRDSTRCRARIGENFPYVFKGARSAPGPGWPPLLGERRARMTLTGRRARMTLTGRRARMTLTGRGTTAADYRAGLSGERCAPGRRLPLLGAPGHGRGSARVVPAACRTGQAPQRSAPGARAAKAAILPALQCEAAQRSPARALRVTRDGLRPPLRVIFPGSGLAPVGRMARSG